VDYGSFAQAGKRGLDAGRFRPERVLGERRGGSGCTGKNRSFLQFLLDHNSYVWFAKLVAVGELLVGIALILGIFVGIAAFFGGLMNFNYMLAGTTSTNPMLFLLAVLLMLAWKTAGYWGLDRFALRWLGTPWKPGDIFHKKTESPQS
jgi:thiosulfate dehydrogenase [quinone] large subunit